jgi:hypothetical protein
LDGKCHAEAGLIASAIAHIGQRVQQVSRGVDPAEEQAPGGGTGSYSGEESINTLEPDDLANMFQAVSNFLLFSPPFLLLFCPLREMAAEGASARTFSTSPSPSPRTLRTFSGQCSHRYAKIYQIIFSAVSVLILLAQASSQLELAIGVARKCCPLCRILADVAEQQYNIKLDLPGQHARFHPWVPPCWLPKPVLLKIESRLLPIVGKLAHSPLPASRASSPGSDDGQDASIDYDEGDPEMADAFAQMRLSLSEIK